MHPATAIKKHLFTKMGGYSEEVRISGDWQFFVLALLRHGASLKRLSLVVAEIAPGGLSQQKGSLARIREEKRQFFLAHPDIRQEAFIDRYLDMEQQLGDISRSRLLRLFVRLGFFRYLRNLFR